MPENTTSVNERVANYEDNVNHSGCFVSIVMSVYNGEEYLKEAIESVLQQTHYNLEFIIIDDGSTDGTLCIINEYQKSDERIKLITQENKELPAALNRGVNWLNQK